ncbi:MAG: CDP-alcohol phosphatidyltransferase family protein [Planctomycetales bacterium]|nr:CDP-alcohol phosphatidyltransferase family protein [Planctomycetales bacterium]
MIFTLANQITILRILLILPFVMCLLKEANPAYAVPMRWLALGIFVIMAASDALDGFLARVKKQSTPLGVFLDPLADKLMITCASVILSLSPTAVEGFRLPLTVVVLVIGKDVLLLLGFAVTYFLTGSIHIKPVWAGKASTFLQICMVLSILIGPEISRWIGFWPIAARVVWWATGFWALMVTIVYIWRGIRYIDMFGNQEKQSR